jgi:Outer membrane protein beta-barrel domain
MRHLHFKLRLPFICFAAVLFAQTAISGERFSVGIIGGAALTDLMDQISGNSEAKHWTVGPILEFRFPASFAAEFSALYRRTGFTSEGYDIVGVITSRVRANSLEFPLLVKYYVGGQSAVARPYFSGGYVLRFLSNAHATIHVPSPPVPDPPPPRTYTAAYGLHSNPSQGMAIGGGLSFKAGPIRIAPEIRYSSWFTMPFDEYGSHGFHVKSAENQVDFLVSVTF